MPAGIFPISTALCLTAAFQANAIPVFQSGGHSPLLPVPGDSVRVFAEITGAVQATLRWRVDGAAALQSLAMSSSGTAWAGTIPPQAGGTVLEFFVEAAGGGTATWPSETGTAMLRVEESAMANTPWTAGAVPVWRFLVRAGDMPGMAGGGVQTSVVIRDGSGMEVRHGCSLRQLEDAPEAFHLIFPSGRAWQGRQSVNFSADRPHCQVFGAAVFVRAGLPAAAVETVEVRLNGSNAAAADSPSHGRFAMSEPFNAAWAARQFPSSPGGNLYRMDDTGPGTHGALGFETPGTAANYAETYLKLAGAAPHDLADIIALTDLLSNSPQATYRQDISQRIGLEQWLRYLALDSLLGNGEPGLQSGRGTDVVLYHLPASERMLLVPHEPRAIMSLGASAGTATRSLFSSEATAGLNRMMTHPDILRSYVSILQHEMTHHFTPAVLDPLITQLMDGWVPANEIAAAKQFVIDRRAAALAQLPPAAPAVTVTGEAAAVEGMATTATGTIVLSGTFPVAEVSSVFVNGQPATLHFRSIGTDAAGTWTFTATEAAGTLRRGTNSFLVEFFSGPEGTGQTFFTSSSRAFYSGGGTTVTTIATGTEVRWTAAGSPWRLTADQSVPANTTLVIEPGVSVYFSAGRKLTVNGILRVMGAPHGRVMLSHPPGSPPVDDPLLPGTQPGPPKWSGITFQNSLSANNIIAYADFENAQVTGSNGSITMKSARCTVDHCSFRGTYLHALYADNSSVTVQDSSFPDSYAPGTEHFAESTLNNDSEYVQMGGSSWPAGAVLRFYRNTFGGVPGHNDVLDINCGKWGVSPVLDVQDNIFLGPTGDDAMDLNGDAYIAGNFFSNIRKDQWTSGLGYSNVAACDKSSAGAATVVMARNIFTRVDHQATVSGDVGLIFEHNTVACQHSDYLWNGSQTVRSGVVAFSIAGDSFSPGDGAYMGYNIFFGSAGHPAGSAGGFPRIFAGADLGGGSSYASKIEMFANFIDPAIQDPVIGSRHPNNVLHASWQGVTGNPQFTDIAADDYSILPASPARGTAPHGLDYGASIPKGCYLGNVPPLVTPLTTANILIGGPGIFAYKWRLDSGAWSAPVGIAPGVFPQTTPTVRTANLALSSLAAGMHTLEVIGQDFAGNWTSESEATRASWTVNTTTPLLFLSEILTGSSGGIEIFNGGTAALSLAGWSLTDTVAAPGKYALSGELAAGAWLTLPASQSGINLSPDGGSVILCEGGTQRDIIAFGPQALVYSFGRTGRERLWSPGTPTPNAANTVLESGTVDSLRLNEWSAGADGWVELMSTDANPVTLDGLRLSSNVAGGISYVFPAHSLIAPGGFLALTAPGPLPFSIDSPDGILTLLDGDAVIDSVRVSRAVSGTSEGRTDPGQVVFFQQPTPGAANGPAAASASFAEWMSLHGVAPAADDDLDGFTSFAEYACATHPRDARSVIRPVLSDAASDGSLQFSFALPQPARADVACRVEFTNSPSAGAWTAIATRLGTGAWTGSATVTAGLSEGGFEPASLRIVPTSGVKTFYRLRFSAL